MAEARRGRLLQVLGYAADHTRYGEETGAHHAMVPGPGGRVGPACGHKYTSGQLQRSVPDYAQTPCPKCERLLGPAMGRPSGSSFGEGLDELDTVVVRCQRCHKAGAIERRYHDPSRPFTCYA